MRAKIVHVVWKRPGEEPVPYEVRADEPEDLQKLIGGFFEANRVGKDVVMWQNEDGIRLGLDPNIKDMYGRTILGPVVIAKHNGGGDQIDLPPLEAAQWTNWLRQQAI